MEGPPCFCSCISSSEMDLNKVLRLSSSFLKTYLRIEITFPNSNIEFKVKSQTKIFAVIKSLTAAFHKTLKLLRSIFSAVHAAKILHTGLLNSCVFPWQNFPRLWFFFCFVFLFFLDAVIPLDRTWHLERSARRILFVTASNYSGTKGNKEGLRRNMAPVYLNVTSTRWMHKLLVVSPPPSLQSITRAFLTMEKKPQKLFPAMFLFCVSPPLSFCLARAELLAAGVKPCEASPTSWQKPAKI